MVAPEPAGTLPGAIRLPAVGGHHHADAPGAGHLFEGSRAQRSVRPQSTASAAVAHGRGVARGRDGDPGRDLPLNCRLILSGLIDFFCDAVLVHGYCKPLTQAEALALEDAGFISCSPPTWRRFHWRKDPANVLIRHQTQEFDNR